MNKAAFAWVLAVCLVCVGCAGEKPTLTPRPPSHPPRELKSITLNTGAYAVAAHTVDRRSESIVAAETMHVVALEHFIGVGREGRSDNGHILSLAPANPWQKWAAAGTGMEPTGTRGHFGYCGRDYYAEVGGIPDVCVYEPLPAGTAFVVPKGARLYMHTYANNFLDTPTAFHHAVRVLYWELPAATGSPKR